MLNRKRLLTAFASLCLAALPSAYADDPRFTDGPLVADDPTSMATLAACNSNLNTTKAALTMWFIDHEDAYPTTLDVLAPDYLKVIMLCPSGGDRPYAYSLGEAGKTFVLTCPDSHGGTTPSVHSDKETEEMWRENAPEN